MPEPIGELDAFYELERLKYLHPGEYYSPTRAKFRHYTLRLAAAKRGIRLPFGPLAAKRPNANR